MSAMPQKTTTQAANEAFIPAMRELVRAYQADGECSPAPPNNL